METKNITPEEKKQDILNAVKAKQKTLGIARHNLLNNIGNIVRKYEDNLKTLSIPKFPTPLEITTVPFTTTKQKDLIFHKTVIRALDGDTDPALDTDEMPVEEIIDILDTLIKNNTD